MKTNYINRRILTEKLTDNLVNKEKQAVPGDNPGYAMGHHLGYMDGLKDALQLVKELPDDPKPEGRRVIYGRPETFSKE